MQEQNRVVRAYSEDTERPYYQIRYRLSLTGRELLADALGGNVGGGMGQERAVRSDSVGTTVFDGGHLSEHLISSDTLMHDEEDDGDEHKVGSTRISRSRSLEAPGDNAAAADLETAASQMPGTPRSAHRKSQQQQHKRPNDGGSGMEICEDPLSNNTSNAELRRTKSAGTAADLQLNRGAPIIPAECLKGGANDHLKGLQEMYPQLVAEFRGLVTCLNSKNVRKYRVGQPYRKGVIVGIDESQGKIVVYSKNMPAGTLIVMRSESATRYEKGYAVQDVQGRMIGIVHAIDKAQNMLVVNTATTAPVYFN